MYYSPVTGTHNASFMKHSALHMKYTKTYVTLKLSSEHFSHAGAVLSAGYI